MKNHNLYLFFEIQTYLYLEIIDGILKDDDLDQDGYLSYLEYVFARRRDEQEEAAEQKRKQTKKSKNNRDYWIFM